MAEKRAVLVTTPHLFHSLYDLLNLSRPSDRAHVRVVVTLELGEPVLVVETILIKTEEKPHGS